MSQNHKLAFTNTGYGKQGKNLHTVPPQEARVTPKSSAWDVHLQLPSVFTGWMTG